MKPLNQELVDQIKIVVLIVIMTTVLCYALNLRDADLKASYIETCVNGGRTQEECLSDYWKNRQQAGAEREQRRKDDYDFIYVPGINSYIVY